MENPPRTPALTDHGGVRLDLVLPPRTLASLVAVVTGATLAAVGGFGLLTGGGDEPVVSSAHAAPALPSATPDPTARPDLRRALRVLAQWDRARAAAYAAEDAERLGELYTPRSTVRAADLALLERYAAAGVRVRDLRMQLLALEVLEAAPGRLRLLVTDRVQDASAVGRRGEVQLRADAPSTRLVVLHGTPGGTWRVSAVRPRSGR